MRSPSLLGRCSCIAGSHISTRRRLAEVSTVACRTRAFVIRRLPPTLLIVHTQCEEQEKTARECFSSRTLSSLPSQEAARSSCSNNAGTQALRSMGSKLTRALSRLPSQFRRSFRSISGKRTPMTTDSADYGNSRSRCSIELLSMLRRNTGSCREIAGLIGWSSACSEAGLASGPL